MHISLKNFLKKKRIHLDYSATTPVHKDVLNAMKPFWNTTWANPSAIYEEGVQARKVIDEVREKLARTLRVRASDITFTSGGTESNNLALLGFIEMLTTKGKKLEDCEIISTKLEHPSILSTLSFLEKKGVHVSYAPVAEDGMIILSEFEKLLNTRVVLVSVAYSNSETGVIQDVKKISRTVRKWNDHNDAEVRVHIDACQAPLWLPCALDALGVDMMSLDAGKCYGPKGAGVLVHRPSVELKPFLLGGDQENGLRAGTENTAMIVGCVLAIVRAQEKYQETSRRVQAIRKYGFELIEREIEDAVVNGSHDSRIANNINISIPGVDTEYAVIVLDNHGVAVSTRSACGSLDSTGSHVVRMMTNDEGRANSTIRFTFGETSKKQDIKTAIMILKKHIEHMKEALQ